MLNKSDQDFNQRLDQAAAERAKLHNEQLAKATLEHERIQKGAKLEIQRLLLEQEQERIRREEAQRREIERLSQERARQEAEAQRRRLEAKQREEQATRQAAEHQRQLQETEARLKARKEQEEAVRKQKREQEEAETKAREGAAAAARVAQSQQPAQVPQKAPEPTPPSAAAAVPSTASQSPAASGLEEIHQKYLDLHTRMKQFRKAFEAARKQQGDTLKQPVGDARRNLRLRIGQVTNQRDASIAAIKRMRESSFDIALNTPGPMIDIRPFIISHEIPTSANEAETQYPAFLLYMWIVFEKCLLKQFDKEAANEDGGIIEKLGLIAASLLADQKYMLKGIPMTDIVLAKLHRICPILFGIRGSMATPQGRARLGWLDKHGLTANSYGQRMLGMGWGFAALSLRQFSGRSPAIAMAEYWRAVVSICNTPSNDLHAGHFMVLKGLLRDFVKKFIAYYGAQAMGVLRRATKELPARAPKRIADSADVVKVLADRWEKSERITIN